MKRWLKILLTAIAAMFVLVGLALLWALNTNAGARFVLARSIAATEGKLSIARIGGTLSGPLTLDDLRWRDSGVDVQIGHVLVDVAPLALATKTLHIENLEIDAVAVTTTTPHSPAQTSAPPPSLRPPIAVRLDRLKLSRLGIVSDEQSVFVADSLTASASWTALGLAIEQLALRSADGEIDLDAKLTSYEDYAGTSKGRFRWRVAGIDYAGDLTAGSDGQQATAHLSLQLPVPATVTASLQPQSTAAWTLAVDAPAFDPKLLAKDSGLQSLALSLKGSGDRYSGTIDGQLNLNGHRVLIDPLRFALDQKLLKLETLTLRSPEAAGRFDAKGTIDLAAAAPVAQLDLRWEGVELPADLAGQVLASHGGMTFNGNAQNFAAKGALALGPPGKLADIALDLDGTGETITLHKLALIQAKGQLQASGTLSLKPVLGWQLVAKAERFDPAAFAAQWPGSLSFTLATQGKSEAAGVSAKIKLDKVEGNLRQRPLTGTADITVAPGFIVDGTLAVASGDSNLAIRGRGGDDTDATVGFTIVSLADMLPDAQGRVHGEFRVAGRWPALSVNGRLDGQTLAYGANRASSLELTAAIADSSAPRGTLTALATGVSIGGLDFERISLDGKGDRSAHELNLVASGEPLSTKLVLRGTNEGSNWNGTLAQLSLAIKDQPEWKLAQATTLSWHDGSASMNELCLVADGPRLCLAGSQGADGNATGRYRIEALPLAMIAALTAPDAPFNLDGQINGSGDLKRSSAGALSGNAKLSSAKGRIAYPDTSGKPLLEYTGFDIDATLTPESQQVNLRAQLSDGGSIDGQITLSGREQALGGQIALNLGTISFVELFTAELASVKGRLDGQLVFAGSVASPLVSGKVDLAGFAAELPAAGLKLHDGSVNVAMSGDGQLRLSGSLASGSGSVRVQGSGGLAANAPLHLEIEGKDFLAADIPAARVVIAPQLKLDRDAQRLQLTGEIAVPEAKADLTKLPGGGAAKTSPDVVVTDALQVEKEKTLPLAAEITLRLGDDVFLKGFGLDGKLDGQLVVVERPGRQTTGRGEIRVGGTYKAYGQDLKIRTGRLLFASTAIDNPGLDLRAVRELKDVTAGLRIQGTAQVPVLTVYSEPAMEQSEALSYLITGRPLSALKSGESDLVGAAAQALGSATGDLLAKSIGARLGVDAAVGDNSALGGAAFTVGKYLSPKLYLSYGVGIFTPGEVISLRYKLSRRWELEAQNATTENRAGLNYRYEK